MTSTLLCFGIHGTYSLSTKWTSRRPPKSSAARPPPRTREKEMSSELPLSTLRVLDLSGEMGAYGSRLFVLAGADVVKVEPIVGDRQRRRPPFAKGNQENKTSLEFA